VISTAKSILFKPLIGIVEVILQKLKKCYFLQQLECETMYMMRSAVMSEPKFVDTLTASRGWLYMPMDELPPFQHLLHGTRPVKAGMQPIGTASTMFILAWEGDKLQRLFMNSTSTNVCSRPKFHLMITFQTSKAQDTLGVHLEDGFAQRFIYGKLEALKTTYQGYYFTSETPSPSKRKKRSLLQAQSTDKDKDEKSDKNKPDKRYTIQDLKEQKFSLKQTSMKSFFKALTTILFDIAATGKGRHIRKPNTSSGSSRMREEAERVFLSQYYYLEKFKLCASKKKKADLLCM